MTRAGGGAGGGEAGSGGGGTGGGGDEGAAGTANTGSGGGGANDTDTPGAGGSGVVILRWLTASSTIGATRTGLTDGGVQTDGSSSYIIFTAGTGNITFS